MRSSEINHINYLDLEKIPNGVITEMLMSLYVYNIYRPNLELYDSITNKNPFSLLDIHSKSFKNTKGIWRKGSIRNWFKVSDEISRDATSVKVTPKEYINLYKSTYKYSGIRNLGATCYMGSYLQYLFMNLDFRSKFLQIPCDSLVDSTDNLIESPDCTKSTLYPYSKLKSGESFLTCMATPSKSEKDSFCKSIEYKKYKMKDNYESTSSNNTSKPRNSLLALSELQKIFLLMESGKHPVVDPSTFAKALKISTENQEDATEFAALLLSLFEDKIEVLEKILNKDKLGNTNTQNNHIKLLDNFLEFGETSSANNSHTNPEYSQISKFSYSNFIPKLFRGTLDYYVECQTCFNKTHILDHFYEIRLQILLNNNIMTSDISNNIRDLNLIGEDINCTTFVSDESGDKKNSPSCITLEKAFDNFFRHERLTGENQYMCELCGYKTDAIKHCTLRELPPYLHICLQRYIYDPCSYTRKKLSLPVDFPMDLNIKPYCGDKVCIERKVKQELNNKSNIYSDNEIIYSQVYDIDTLPNEMLQYEFIGILEHQGQSAMSGHYTASLKDFEFISPCQAEDCPYRINVNGTKAKLSSKSTDKSSTFQNIPSISEKIPKYKKGGKNSHKKILMNPETLGCDILDNKCNLKDSLNLSLSQESNIGSQPVKSGNNIKPEQKRSSNLEHSRDIKKRKQRYVFPENEAVSRRKVEVFPSSAPVELMAQYRLAQFMSQLKYNQPLNLDLSEKLQSINQMLRTEPLTPTAAEPHMSQNKLYTLLMLHELQRRNATLLNPDVSSCYSPIFQSLKSIYTTSEHSQTLKIDLSQSEVTYEAKQPSISKEYIQNSESDITNILESSQDSTIVDSSQQSTLAASPRLQNSTIQRVPQDDPYIKSDIYSWPLNSNPNAFRFLNPLLNYQTSSIPHANQSTVQQPLFDQDQNTQCSLLNLGTTYRMGNPMLNINSVADPLKSPQLQHGIALQQVNTPNFFGQNLQDMQNLEHIQAIRQGEMMFQQVRNLNSNSVDNITNTPNHEITTKNNSRTVSSPLIKFKNGGLKGGDGQEETEFINERFNSEKISGMKMESHTECTKLYSGTVIHENLRQTLPSKCESIQYNDDQNLIMKNQQLIPSSPENKGIPSNKSNFLGQNTEKVVQEYKQIKQNSQGITKKSNKLVTKHKFDVSHSSHEIQNIKISHCKCKIDHELQKRWNWVHFNDKDVQEWYPKTIGKDNKRMTSKTGYMLIYKRKDWDPKLKMSHSTKETEDLAPSPPLPKKEENRSKLYSQQITLISTAELKCLSDICDIRRKHVEYLRDCVLQPTLKKWSDKWLYVLEVSQGNDEYIASNFPFLEFVTVPSAWWSDFIYGMDICKAVLRYKRDNHNVKNLHNRELIDTTDLWDLSSMQCIHCEVGKKILLSPLAFWNGRLKLFPPEAFTSLLECLEVEKQKIQNIDLFEDSIILKNSGVTGMNPLILKDMICSSCSKELYTILQISLSELDLISEMYYYEPDHNKQEEICVLNVKVINNILKEYDIDKCNRKSKGKPKSERRQLLFKDIEAQIEKLILETQSEKTGHGNSRVFTNNSDNILDLSKDIRPGSPLCPHDLVVIPRFKLRIFKLVPTKLVRELIRLENLRAEKISNYLNSFNRNSKLEAKVRYMCSNIIKVCWVCTIQAQ
ncbi:ubiquitin carboxyl-terminal hydrolase family protein [Cryptosporidium andersoni]|uniref:ubiquitinyl hydrolase 1 n=1 Tax=Cryptosporidium andersoni TaxID=117008 RepID=A0A1J4MVI9_9CRYT|nr:ubiquitin carboxyl-terminal hydrolase family protein [Cryptosporidium andersoni]